MPYNLSRPCVLLWALRLLSTLSCTGGLANKQGPESQKFYTLCLNEGRGVIDANCSISSPEQMIPSTPVSQGRKSHAAKGSPCFC